MMRNAVSLAITVTLLNTFSAGCGLDEMGEEDVELAEDELASHVTISRVPNPPLLADLNNLPGDLRVVAAPLPDLTDFIKDRDAAIALGKALFWDMQVGSDGVQACGTCHFRAGADPRSKNQVSPGLKHMPAPDVNFHRSGPNSQLTARDFPLTKLAVPGVRGQLHPTKDNNDVVASQGIHYMGPEDLDPMGFNVEEKNTRRVEPRNTPSVINSVYNHRQFWDGRAENVFNGVNHLGKRDPNARVVRANSSSSPELVRIELVNASLASQATVPALSDMEMSEPSRSMFELGDDLLERRPLAKQKVHRKDSVLGDLSRSPRNGLKIDTYAEMVRNAFQAKWWQSNKLVRIAQDGSISFVSGPDNNPRTHEMTMMNYNFSLYFGISLMLYQATLVSDDSQWDRFRRQHPSPTDPALNPWTNTNPEHISRAALWGAMLFNDRTRGPANIRCSNCHESNEMTDASVRRVTAAVNGPVRNRDGNIIDKGFNNIGVRPTSDDLGVGGSDAFGPLSHAKRLFPGAAPATFDGAAVDKGFAVQGAFKIPSLRNVALTAPYFHNGDARTLREVIELYSRGGNVFPIKTMDNVTVEPLGTPNLTEDEIRALIAFLKSLTDERVLKRQAPFDHPQLFVPNGHRGDDDRVRDRDRDNLADDEMIEISAVGEDGGRPIAGFLEGQFGPRHGHHDHHHNDNDCDGRDWRD